MGSEKRERKKHNQAARRAALEAARKHAERRKRLQRFGILGLVLVVGVVGVTFLATRGGGDDETVEAGASTTRSTVAPPAKIGTQACPNPDGSSPKMAKFDGAFKDDCTDPAKAYTATMTTDAGVITIAFDAKKAPKTVNNFVSLARYKYYDGLTFHRVLKGFVLQGGDPQGTGSGGPGYAFNDELPQRGEYEIGSLAMANSGPNTNGSQFFIISGDNGAALPPQYSLFGKVTAGLDVVKAIEADGSDADPTPPAKLHKILTVTIAEA